MYHSVLCTVDLAFLYQLWWLWLLVIIATLYIFTTMRIRYVKQRNTALEAHLANHTSEIQETLRALQQSEAELRRQTVIQDKIITAITHDIRTPIRYIGLAAGRVNAKAQQGNYSGVEDFSASVQDTAKRINDLIDNLMQYMKTHGGQGEINFEPVNLYRLITEKAELFANAAQQNGNTFHNKINAGMEVISNRQLLSVIIHNLMDNACKYTINGTINLQISRADGRHQLTVSDTGKGMPAEIVAWLNDGARQQKLTDSQGSGLIMIKEIAALLNITLYVEAWAGQGTVFHVIFNDATIKEV